jgi:hypothetical protein
MIRVNTPTNKVITNKAKNTVNKGINKITNRTKNIGYREVYTNEAKRILKTIGNNTITKMTICRAPVNNMLIKILNGLSFGVFTNLMKTHGFDKLYHLSLLLEINGKTVIIEKLAEINISYDISNSFNQASTLMSVSNYLGILSLNQLTSKTKEYMGVNDYFDYNAFTNNCQNFILSILRANDISNSTYENFIYQDITKLYESLQEKAPQTSKVAKMTTRMGALWNRLTGKGKIDILERKEYPLNYSTTTENIINILSFDNKKTIIRGSEVYKYSKYPVDIDLFETVKINNMDDFINELQEKIQDINKTDGLILGDVKIGVNEDRGIIDDESYYENGHIIGNTYKDLSKRAIDLFNNGFISKDEKNKVIQLSKGKMTKTKFNILKEQTRYHILRWKPVEILKGVKEITKGYYISLEEALSSNGLFKIDVIGFIDNRFIEFTIIYDLRDNNNKRVNNFMVNIEENLKENINIFIEEGKNFKALKRYFSLLKYRYANNKKYKTKEIEETLLKLIDFFNSEVGLLNQIIGDIDTILYLYENDEDIPENKMEKSINSFILRLSSIYKNSLFLKSEKLILNELRNMIKNTKTIEPTLIKIKDKLKTIINLSSKKFVDTIIKN